MVSALGARVSALDRKAAAWGASEVLRLYGGKGPHELSLAFVGPGRIRALNRKYRGKDRVTDVLSFPLGEVVDGRLHAGDVVICLARARAQAHEFGHPLRDEIRLLAVHGTLHLLGFEHHGRKADPMRKAEKRILGPADFRRRAPR